MLQCPSTPQQRKHASHTTGLLSGGSEDQQLCSSIFNPNTSQSAGRPSAAAMKARDQELMPQLIRFLLDHPRLKAREKVPCAFRLHDLPAVSSAVAAPLCIVHHLPL